MSDPRFTSLPDRLVDSVVQCLVSQVPNLLEQDEGSSLPSSLREELRLQILQRPLDDNAASADDIIDQALIKARKIYPATTKDKPFHTTASKPVSFSLFDQFSGGGLLDSIVTWDRVQEAPRLQDKLKLLEKVEYIDDLLPDWSELSRFLLETLHQDPLTGLSLHNSFFDLARSSSTPSIQVDLILNLVAAVDQVMETSRKEEEVDALVKSYTRMWLDLMFSHVDDEEMDSLSSNVMAWLCRDSFPSLIAVSLMQADPYARCFATWTGMASPRQIRQALIDNKDALPVLLAYCNSRLHVGSDATLRYSLSLLCCLLAHLRVSCLPWGLIPNMPREQALNLLMDCYMQEHKRSISEYDTTMTYICEEAIDTMLWGCKGSPLFSSLKEKAEVVKSKSIETILNRLE